MLLPTTIMQVSAARGQPCFVERAIGDAALETQTVATPPEEAEWQGGAVTEEEYNNM